MCLSSHEQLSIALLISRSRITRLLFQQLVPHSFLCPTCITRRFTLLCCSSSARKTDLVRMCRAKKHLRQDRTVALGTRHAVTEAIFGRVHQHARNPAKLSEDFPFKPHQIQIALKETSVRIMNHVRSGASNEGPKDLDKPQLHQRCAVDYRRGRPDL